MGNRPGSESGPPPVEHYPPYVVTSEQRHRWDLAHAIAELVFGDTGDAAAVWMAARTVYRLDLPTDEPSDPADDAPGP